MAKAKTGPLTEEHLKTLNKLLEACKETERYCQQCHECSLDVEPELEKTREQLKVASAIKRLFFPQAK